MLMNIWVKDKTTEKVHQVGTDVHDSLIVVDGVILYRNLQNGEISGGDYEFVDAPDSDEFVAVTPDQLLLNRELVHKEVLALIDNSINDSAADEDDSGLNVYDVTVTRTGGVVVKAESEEQAIEMVRSMSVAEIDAKGSLTGWETSDVEHLNPEPTYEYIIEIHNENGLESQLDAYDNYDEALKAAIEEKKSIVDDQKILIVTVEYEGETEVSASWEDV